MSPSRRPTASRKKPCPVCGRANRCRVAPDGMAAVCWRSGGKAAKCARNAKTRANATSHAGDDHRLLQEQPPLGGYFAHLWNAVVACTVYYQPNAFAVGLIGVALAAAIILGVLRSPIIAVAATGLALAGMILLVEFRNLARDGKPSLQAEVLTWVVIGLLALFLILLFTALVFDWPATLAKRLFG